MHTRFPVYEDNTDNVIGIINMKDLLVYPKDKPFSIRNILREPYFTWKMRSRPVTGTCSGMIRAVIPIRFKIGRAHV